MTEKHTVSHHRASDFLTESQMFSALFDDLSPFGGGYLTLVTAADVRREIELSGMAVPEALTLLDDNVLIAFD